MLFHVFFFNIKYECISKVNIMFHMASSKVVIVSPLFSFLCSKVDTFVASPIASFIL